MAKTEKLFYRAATGFTPITFAPAAATTAPLPTGCAF